MLLIILAWIFWGLFIYNIGLFVVRYFFSNKDLDVFYSFWVGMFVLSGTLQYVSLFTSIDKYVLISISIVNLVFFLFNIKYFWSALVGVRVLANSKYILYTLFLLITVAILANEPVVWYDTYLYHLNSVRWLTDYGSVNGLANLHNRLGINNISFPVAALMDVSLFSSKSSHVYNSLLVAVLVAQTVYNLFDANKNKIVKLFSVFSLLFVPQLIQGQINSLSTDLTLSVLVIVSTNYMLTLSVNKYVYLFPVFLLASTSKYSFFVASLFLIIYTFWKTKEQILSALNIKILFISVLFMVGFCLRNIVLSGWPMYPLAIAGMSVEWKVPRDQVVLLSDTVKSWARQPGPNYLSSLEQPFVTWFKGWFNNNKLNGGPHYLLFGLILFIYYLRSLFRNDKRIFMILLSYILAVVYVFNVAPDFRFMNIYIFMLVFVAMSYIFSKILVNSAYKIVSNIVMLFVATVLFVRVTNFDKPVLLFDVYIENSGLVQAQGIEYNDQKFYVWVPVNSDMCGNSQLPCTPYINNFKLIDQRDFTFGFKYTDESRIVD